MEGDREDRLVQPCHHQGIPSVERGGTFHELHHPKSICERSRLLVFTCCFPFCPPEQKTWVERGHSTKEHISFIKVSPASGPWFLAPELSCHCLWVMGWWIDTVQICRNVSFSNGWRLMDPALLQVALLYPRGFSHATDVPLSPSITMWISILLKASACLVLESLLLCLLTEWAHVNFYGRWRHMSLSVNYGADTEKCFQGLLRKARLLVPFLNTLWLPPRSPCFVCLVLIHPLSLSLLTAVLVLACPYPQMIGDDRSSCRVRSLETRWSLLSKLCLSQDTSVLTVKIKLYRLWVIG